MTIWQRFMIFAVALGLLLWGMQLAFAEIQPTERGGRATYQFRKYNACPSTGKFSGPCPGWVMDHLESLRCGGKDIPENLWWQRIGEARVKDTQEDECWRYYRGPRYGY